MTPRPFDKTARVFIRGGKSLIFSHGKVYNLDRYFRDNVWIEEKGVTYPAN